MAGVKGRSGRQAEKPIDPKDLAWLYRGIKVKLLAGDADAQNEFLLRLDQLRLQNKVSGKQHQDLTKSATVRRSVTAHVAAERRTKRLEVVAGILDRALGGTGSPDIGPPPDDMPGGHPEDDGDDPDDETEKE